MAAAFYDGRGVTKHSGMNSGSIKALGFDSVRPLVKKLTSLFDLVSLEVAKELGFTDLNDVVLNERPPNMLVFRLL